MLVNITEQSMKKKGKKLTNKRVLTENEAAGGGGWCELLAPGGCGDGSWFGVDELDDMGGFMFTLKRDMLADDWVGCAPVPSVAAPPPLLVESRNLSAFVCNRRDACRSTLPPVLPSLLDWCAKNTSNIDIITGSTSLPANHSSALIDACCAAVSG